MIDATGVARERVGGPKPVTSFWPPLNLYKELPGWRIQPRYWNVGESNVTNTGSLVKDLKASVGILTIGNGLTRPFLPARNIATGFG